MNTLVDSDRSLSGALPEMDAGIGRLWKSVIALMTALTLATGLAIGGAQTAVAAGPSMTACFVYQSGAAYASQPVYLYHQVAGVWKESGRSGKTNANGCATFQNLTANRRHQIRAFMTYKTNYWTEWIGNFPLHHYSIYKYDGWAAAYYVQSSVHVGTFWVYGPTFVTSV